MDLKALFLNCTLKKSPRESNTEALMRKVMSLMEGLGAGTELVRVADFNIPFGVSSDEGEGDEWPQILQKVKAADILVIGTPIWFGVRRYLAHNVVWFARLLKQNPIPTNLNELIAEAQTESGDVCPSRHGASV